MLIFLEWIITFPCTKFSENMKKINLIKHKITSPTNNNKNLWFPLYVALFMLLHFPEITNYVMQKVQHSIVFSCIDFLRTTNWKGRHYNYVLAWVESTEIILGINCSFFIQYKIKLVCWIKPKNFKLIWRKKKIWLGKKGIESLGWSKKSQRKTLISWEIQFYCFL